MKQKVISDAVNRFMKTSMPEVFIVNTGGHWVTIRIERMPNGMVGILFVDSGRKTLEANANWLKKLSILFV